MHAASSKRSLCHGTLERGIENFPIITLYELYLTTLLRLRIFSVFASHFLGLVPEIFILSPSKKYDIVILRRPDNTVAILLYSSLSSDKERFLFFLNSFQERHASASHTLALLQCRSSFLSFALFIQLFKHTILPSPFAYFRVSERQSVAQKRGTKIMSSSVYQIIWPLFRSESRYKMLIS